MSPRNDFYNGEHYPDPTAYWALENIALEERRRKRRNRQPAKPREVPGSKPPKEEKKCNKP